MSEDVRWRAIAAGLDPRLAPVARPAPGDCEPEFPPVPSGQIVTDLPDISTYQPST